MATILDVARESGVSKSTVSLVLRGSLLIRAEKRERVLAAAKRIGYRPNLGARRLKGGRSGTIGVIIPNLSNPFFSEMMDEVESVLGQANTMALLGASHESPEMEAELMERMSNRGVDALILVPCRRQGEYYRNFQTEKRIPIVTASRNPPGSGADAVVPDNERGGYEIGLRAAETGRAIYFIRSTGQNITVMERLRGFRRALQERGLSFQLHRGGRALTVECGILAAESFPEKNIPAVVFAPNDMVAFGFMKGLLARKLRVPEDVAVYGFDGLELFRLGLFDLGGMKVDAQQIGRRAAELLLKRLTSGQILPEKPEIEMLIPVFQTGQTI